MIMKQLVSLIALSVAILLGACSNNSANNQQLPEEIKSFITENFSDQTITSFDREQSPGGHTFEVVLSNGTEVDFDTKNIWEKVEGFTNPVPVSIIPAPIASHVQATFPDNDIVEIDKERYGFDVRLSDGMELQYDKNGGFKKVEK